MRVDGWFFLDAVFFDVALWRVTFLALFKCSWGVWGFFLGGVLFLFCVGGFSSIGHSVFFFLVVCGGVFVPVGSHPGSLFFLKVLGLRLFCLPG